MSQQQYAKLVHHNSMQKQEKRENISGGEQRLVFFDLERVHFHRYLAILALFDVK